MQIGGLQKLTLIDFPGKLACTLFLKGCSFRCPWCFNPEFVLIEKKEEDKISEKEFFDFLREKKNLLEGVVLGGGEPTINPELIKFCKKIKTTGYSIKLDTNGSNFEMLKNLINKNLIDYVALDVKAPKEKYLKIIGMEAQFPGLKSIFWKEKIIKNVEKSINLLKEGKIDYEFRTTIIPTLLKKEDILKIARWIKPTRPGDRYPKYFLQNFRPEKTIDPKFEKIKPYSEEYLLGIQKAIAPFFDICQIRG